MALYSQIAHQNHDWDMTENLNACPNEESGISDELPRASKQHENLGVGLPPGLVAKKELVLKRTPAWGYISKQHGQGDL